jgi:hypothetical protein
MAVPEARSVIDYLEHNLSRVIRNDLVAVLQFHEKQEISGFHSVAREVFCYIDYLGSIFRGPPAESEKAISFIETYMTKADRRYKQIGRLIYEMWRHGTVHEFDPKILKHSRRKYSIGWLTNNSSAPVNRACHLECFKKQNIEDKYVIAMNLFELVDHLMFALKAFIDQLKRSKALARTAQQHFDEISHLATVKELRCGKSKKRKLNLQITGAVTSQKREVDEVGSVVS